jgi:antitoxin (DNA-binding transcriptional repressor) of toxin-antitoxin stability system
MKTIGAKELRLNLDKILDQVLAGEDIIVQHRFKDPVRLSAVQAASRRQPLAGLKAFEAAPKKPFPYDKNKPINEIYDELLIEKYGK